MTEYNKTGEYVYGKGGEISAEKKPFLCPRFLNNPKAIPAIYDGVL
ncbi:MAG TPA: hypothetical protein VFF09_05750 [archaeon]|nr:hypothetical protein [archaeon]